MDNANRDARVEGSWQDLRGRVREAWGALTDDDAERARGSRERLVGVIRQRTGESLDTVEQKLSEILDRVESKGMPREERSTGRT